MPPLLLVALPVIIVVVIIVMAIIVVIVVVRLRRLWVRCGRLGLRVRRGRLWLRRWAGVWLRGCNSTGQIKKATTAAALAVVGHGHGDAPINVRRASGQGQEQDKVFHFVTSGGAGKGIQCVGCPCPTNGHRVAK